MGRAADTWVIGSGGKTSLLQDLARQLTAAGDRCVLGTTTHLWATDGALVEPHGHRLAAAVAANDRWPLTVAAARQGAKLRGHAPDTLLSLLPHCDHLLVEADGARGLPLKAHAAHEPVLPAQPSRVILVLGVSALGRPLDERTVHRPQRFVELTGVPHGTLLLPEHLARILACPGGWLARLPAGPPPDLVLNQIDAVRPQRLASLRTALEPLERAGLLGSVSTRGRGCAPTVPPPPRPDPRG